MRAMWSHSSMSQVVVRAVTSYLAFGLMLAGAVPAGCGGSGPAQLTHDQLVDPLTCKTCHPTQYQDWSGSMHAFATDDPVFQAMNGRAQVGTFCLNCHAPLAVRGGLTDG